MRQPPSRSSAMPAEDRSAPGARQDKWIANDHDPVSLRLWECAPPDSILHAMIDCGIAHRRRVIRVRHLAVPGNRELNDEATTDVLVTHHFLLVAVLHLVEVAADDATDDL